ncbi:MAG: transglutaminase domain-containing protein [Patescibacteria group bacterium]
MTNKLTKQKLLKAISLIPKNHNQAYVEKVIKTILSLFDQTKYYVLTTKNYRLSRTATINFILKNRLRTCGSIATVLAYVLRSVGFTVVLVDGKLKKDNKWSKHGWIKVKLGRTWRSFDPFSLNFRVNKKNHKVVGAHSSWKEIKHK